MSRSRSSQDPLYATRRRRGRVTRVVQALLLACVLGCFAVMAVAVAGGGWQIRPVLSGSMRPGLPIGGVVVTKREPLADLQVRDVAVFHPPGQPNIDYVHRVVSLTHSDGVVVIHTQGDANLYPDPWTLRLHGRYAYIAQFTVPLVGYPAVWLHSPRGRADMLLVAAFLALVLLGSLATDLRRRRRRAPGTSVGAVAPSDTTTPITVRGLGTPTERTGTISR